MNSQDIYDSRQSFSIIALTGKTGSGCTRFAQIISKPPSLENVNMLRRPQDISIPKPSNDDANNDAAVSTLIFKRKYTICYDYFKANFKEYKTISYTSAVLYYIIHYCIHNRNVKNSDELSTLLCQLVMENFRLPMDSERNIYEPKEINEKELKVICNLSDDALNIFKKIPRDFSKINNRKLKPLYDSFFGVGFEEFSERFFQFLGRVDYYLGSLFVHRIGNKIRATGNPFINSNKIDKNENIENVYNIAILINKLIKSYKYNNKICHICVDSLRNSLEIMFFKERYSAFYLISIHNEGRHFERIKKRIKSICPMTYSNNHIDEMVKNTLELDDIENRINDFKHGCFYSPDVENCIQKSELHIYNPGKDEKLFDEEVRKTSFYTMAEQWMKIHSLILHPGLITPSHEERCMQIAYNIKYNSGCISRQVGAIITDENHAIRSVGWNDVPKGSVPCLLRNMSDVINPQKTDNKDFSYSHFEMDENNKYKDGKSFSVKSRELFHDAVNSCEELGLNHSFCFKTLHNLFEEKENQVHTRSLHAEENAMLQVSKYGGQPLKNGILFTTASPCELCSKKAYQLGIKSIIYIDPYPGISMEHILNNGYNRPKLKMFTGIIGRSYNKLFEPFMAYKDEISLITNNEINTKITFEHIKNDLEKWSGVKINGKMTENKFKEILKRDLAEKRSFSHLQNFTV